MRISEFEYYIACRHTSTKEMEIIAAFQHESDRDCALGALEDMYDDSEFEKVSKE